MPGISTEYLAEQIEASNERLTKAIEDLTRKVEEGQKEFVAFRLDVTKSVHDFGNDLKWVKRIGAFVATLLVAAIFGAGRVIWDASAVNAEVKQQGKVLEEVRSEVKQQGARLDAMDRKLDTLLSRTAPKMGE